MVTKSLKMLLNGVLTMFFLGIISIPAFGFKHDDGACVANAETLQQLGAARQATAKYHSIKAAEADGYTNINLPIPNMGEHWVNFDLVDGTFESDKPEALVYADLGNGRLQLVAVEYLAPYVEGAPPSGFAGTCDQWSPFGPGPDLWTLHAWIWEPNLSGTFAKFNPLIP